MSRSLLKFACIARPAVLSKLSGKPYSSHPEGNYSWRYRSWDIQLKVEFTGQTTIGRKEEIYQDFLSKKYYSWKEVPAGYRGSTIPVGESMVIPVLSENVELDSEEESQVVASSNKIQQRATDSRDEENAPTSEVENEDDENVTGNREENLDTVESQSEEEEEEKEESDVSSPPSKIPRLEYCWNCGQRLLCKRTDVTLSYCWKCGVNLVVVFQ